MEIFDRDPVIIAFYETHAETRDVWRCRVLGREYIVKPGTDTDGMSAPRLLLWLTGDRFAPDIIGPSLWHDDRYRRGDCGRLFADFVYGITVMYSIVVMRLVRVLWWISAGSTWRVLVAPIVAAEALFRLFLSAAMTIALLLAGWTHWHHKRGRWSVASELPTQSIPPKVGEND